MKRILMTQRLAGFVVIFAVAAILGWLCGMPLPLNMLFSVLFAVVYVYVASKRSRRFSKADVAWLKHIADLWGGSLTSEYGDYYIGVDALDTFITYSVRDECLYISFSTYTNPYTQTAKEVIDSRRNDILQLNGVTADGSTYEHSLFGGSLSLKVLRTETSDWLMEKLKKRFARIKEEERAHQTDICFKVVGVECDDDVCYVECSYQSDIKRAIVVWPDKTVSRYDVSRGDELPGQLAEMQQSAMYIATDDETFELLSPQAFEQLWEPRSNLLPHSS